MSQRQRRPGRDRGRMTIQGALVVCLLCGMAIAPLLRGDSPCTHDGGLHFFRVAAMREALNGGIVFSRWLPDLAFGYGFPFFNYRAPISYYLPLGLHLIGLPLSWALNLVYVLSLLISALGAYLLGRDLFGPWAGVLSGVVYAYAPYQLLDALVRGNAPESLALALMPLILWAFRRLLLEKERRWFMASALSLATLYLTHNISSLLFTPLLLTYIALLWYVYRERAAWREAILASALALALPAFFWAPALAEKGYVQLYLTSATRNNDFHHNFLSMGEIFALPRPFDTSLMNPLLDIRLGFVPVVLAGLGVVCGLLACRRLESGLSRQVHQAEERAGDLDMSGWAVRERRLSLLFFLALLVLFVFMSTSASVWLWEHVPLLPFVQFPWRFVGRASLPVALLAGAVLLPFAEGRRRSALARLHLEPGAVQALAAILIGLAIMAAFPATYPPGGYCPMMPYPSVEDVHRYERNTGLVGVDPVGAYFPVWVEERPRGSTLEAQYASGAAVRRFDASVLPQGAQVVASDYGPNRARIEVESPRAFRARYLTFYFPGWRVWVDGERVEVTPSDQEGLITFEVPAGRHTVSIRFGETAVRLAADIVSLIALLCLVGMGLWLPRAHREERRESSGAPPWQSGLCSGSSFPESDMQENRSPVAGYWGLVLLAVCLTAFKLLVVDSVHTPFRHPRLRPDGTLPGVDHPLGQAYADGLHLIGYDQSAGEMPGDGTLRIDLYWTARQQPSRRYQTVIHLVGPERFRWSPQDSYRPTDYQDPPPTTTWRVGRYAIDTHEVEPLPGTPPGRYDIVLTVFDRETLVPLSVLNDQGQRAAPELALGKVTLRAPQHNSEDDDLDVRQGLDVGLGVLTLLRARVDRDEAMPGDPVYLTTFWRADERPEEDLVLRVVLLDSDGRPVADCVRPPAAPWHPTSAWNPGDVWRGQHLITLPADLETGVYTWTLSLSPSFSPTVPLSDLSVTAPSRTFTPPPVTINTNVTLGDVATLVGANLEPPSLTLEPGSALTVTLVWRAEAETDVSYRAFLHLSDRDGQVVAQSDGVPDEWRRPTTSWVPGEIITDVRTLAIPDEASPGEYTLTGGLYTPVDGRLTDSDGRDAVQVSTVTLAPP